MLKHHKSACAFNLSHKSCDDASPYACTCNCSSVCAWELSSLEVLYPNPLPCLQSDCKHWPLWWFWSRCYIWPVQLKVILTKMTGSLFELYTGNEMKAVSIIEKGQYTADV